MGGGDKKSPSTVRNLYPSFCVHGIYKVFLFQQRFLLIALQVPLFEPVKSGALRAPKPHFERLTKQGFFRTPQTTFRALLQSRVHFGCQNPFSSTPLYSRSSLGRHHSLFERPLQSRAPKPPLRAPLQSKAPKNLLRAPLQSWTPFERQNLIFERPYKLMHPKPPF